MGAFSEKFECSGKRAITQEKPGTALEKVIIELQEKCIADISVVKETGGTVPVALKAERISENEVQLSGSINVDELEGVGIGGSTNVDEETLTDYGSSDEPEYGLIDKAAAETYMVFQKKADGTFGFDYVRAHS